MPALPSKHFYCARSGDRRPLPGSVSEGLAAAMARQAELVQCLPILLDGAHNPQAASTLSEFIRRHLAGYHIILIAGIMSDKDITGILSPLLPLASDIIFTAPNYGRSAPPVQLSGHAASLGFKAAVASTIRDAMSLATKIAFSHQSVSDTPPLILITGSFFTVGEAKEILGEKAVLGHLREGFNKQEMRNEK